MNYYRGPGTAWKVQPFKDENPAFFQCEAPCRFHRWMQRIFFGFKWTRI